MSQDITTAEAIKNAAARTVGDFSTLDEYRAEISKARRTLEMQERLLPYYIELAAACKRLVEDSGWGNAKLQLNGGGTTGTQLESAMSAFLSGFTPTQAG